MKKTILTVASLFALLVAPLSASAAINSINGQNGTAQTLATTSAATTTMHMKIVSSANTHTFRWDNTPWTVDQGGTGQTSFTSGELIYGNGTSALTSNSSLKWDTAGGFLSMEAGPTFGLHFIPSNSEIDFGRGGFGFTTRIAENDGIVVAGPSTTALQISKSDPAGSSDGPAELDVHLLSSVRRFKFPDFSGTFGLLQADQTWTGNNTFSKGAGTTTVNFGTMGDATSHTCFNTKNTDGGDISFYFVGTSMVVENNACQ